MNRVSSRSAASNVKKWSFNGKIWEMKHAVPLLVLSPTLKSGFVDGSGLECYKKGYKVALAPEVSRVWDSIPWWCTLGLWWYRGHFFFSESTPLEPEPAAWRAIWSRDLT